jgi:hypothetical protein
MRNLSRFFAVGAPEKLFLLHCVAVLVVVRLALSLKSHDTLRRRIAAMQASSPAALHDLRLVSWGVTAAARWIPHASCLTQALAGQYLLARRGKASLVRIGVERNTGAELKAHAWLISGNLVVLGGPPSTLANFTHLIDYGR